MESQKDDDMHTDGIREYTKLVKNPMNYKNEMIVSICLGVTIILILSFFFNGTLEFTTAQ